jgi:hypothetical protein
MPQVRQLNRELLLDIIDTLAEEFNDRKLTTDKSTHSLGSDI